VLPPSWRSSARRASALGQRSVIVSWSRHRVGEAGGDEHVAEVVHVDERRASAGGQPIAA
jgi:hypothetical protein